MLLNESLMEKIVIEIGQLTNSERVRKFQDYHLVTTSELLGPECGHQRHPARSMGEELLEEIMTDHRSG